jgi:hypothetical protein
MLLGVLSILVTGKVSRITLKEAVLTADLIVIGKVSRVNAGPQKSASITVERVLKGTPPKELSFSAFPTWTCDTSNAVLGERGVFLLDRPNHYPHPKIRDRSLWTLIDSGRGRIVFDQGDIRVDRGSLLDYILPKGFLYRGYGGGVWINQNDFTGAIIRLVNRRR